MFIDTRKFYEGVDISGIEKITKYRQEHENDRDVLEIYDDKMRESQKSFFDKPPSTHGSSRNFQEDEKRRSFYDGSGRYSQQTHNLASLYISQKPNYENGRYDMNQDSGSRLGSLPRINNNFSPMNTQRQVSPLRITNVQSTRHLGQSMSMADINNRIRGTIDQSRMAYRM